MRSEIDAQAIGERWLDVGRHITRWLGVPQRREKVNVAVDSSKCARFGFCEHEAPKVFALRGDGRLAYKATVPPHLANDVIRAVEVCPARAIQLNRTATTVVTQKKTEPAEQPLTGPTRIPAGSGAGPRRRSRGDR